MDIINQECIDPGINGIGFILPNVGSSEPLQDFAVKIDSVERLAGIDFYPSLRAIEQSQIEKTCVSNAGNGKALVPPITPKEIQKHQSPFNAKEQLKQAIGVLTKRQVHQV